MVEPSSSLTNVVQRYRQGDPDAARELFGYYAQRLSRLAEQYISRRLAGRVDGDDVVQSVFRTFFRRTAQGEFQIDSSAQLWQLLVRITVRKARSQGRYHTAAVRDVRAEQPGGGEDWLTARLPPGNALSCRLRRPDARPGLAVRRAEPRNQAVNRVLRLVKMLNTASTPRTPHPNTRGLGP